MAILDESFYDPVPGYTQTRRRRTETPPPADVPRGGMPVPGSDPLSGVPERDILPETFADPLSPTRSMRYGPGDERDLGAPPPPPPPGWRPPMPSELPPARPDPTAPSPLFSGVAGEDFEATRRRGEQVARLMREQDGPFANPNDWNYVRSYGPRAAAQAVASGRANISGAPPELVAQERERFLRNRTTDLSISPQLRSAARDELAQIERDAAEERRREMWAAEQAARLQMAEGANAATVEAARLTAQGQEAAAKAKAEAEAAAAAAAANAAASKPVPMDAETPGMFVGENWVDNPAYNPKPVTGGGNSVATWDRENKTWKVEWPKNGNKSSQFSTLKPGETAYNQDTGEYFVAPGTDRISIQAEIAGWQKAYTDTNNPTDKKKIEDKIADAQRRLAALGAPPEQPAPAPTATAQPTPAATEQPAQSAEQPAAPPRRRRFEG